MAGFTMGTLLGSVGAAGAVAQAVGTGLSKGPASLRPPTLLTPPDPAIASAAAEHVAQVRNVERGLAANRRPPTLLTDPTAVPTGVIDRKTLLGS